MRSAWAALAAAFLFVSAGEAHETDAASAAGTPASPRATARDFETYVPRVNAVRISEDDAPVIDGDLSDPVWAQAAVIDEFYQVEPVEGAAPSQKTRAYVMYDRDNLYVGIYMYDTDPALIRRSQLQRDLHLKDDDGVRVLIDSFGTFRDGFLFGVNPNGARIEGLAENNATFRPEWNTIWRAKARVVEDGWIAEYAIPFRSISFDPSLKEWNFQIIRVIRRNNEEIRWSNIDQSRNRINLTNPGRLAGIRDVNRGRGLEAQLYVTGAAKRDWELEKTDFDLTPSGNIFYKITPSLTGSLTFNTDFADTPLDERQVNTGRFDLFFPETRDFFLQDAAVFEFGGRVFHDNENGMPFFSRNIGIVDGHPVDIVAGAKLSGKAGPASVGIISARTAAADAIGVDGQYLSAARISVPVLSESKAGIVFTNGDPTGATNNTVAGADFQYKRSNLFGDGTLYADLTYQRSFNDGVADDMIGAEASYRSEGWNGRMRLRDIGENYAPKLGFVNRTGIRRYNGEFWRRYRPEGSFVRKAETGAFTNLITDTNDERVDQYSGAWINAETNDGDVAEARYERGFVDIREPFLIADAVSVAPGEYRWDQYELSAETSRGRKIAVQFDVTWGGLYDGDMTDIRSELLLRPSKHFELSAEHEYIDISLPSGAVGIHIASVQSTIAFTPDMSVKTEVQYDNVSEAFTFFSRFSWAPVPEREIFLSFGHTALIESEDFPRNFHSLGSTLALRLGQTFRL